MWDGCLYVFDDVEVVFGMIGLLYCVQDLVGFGLQWYVQCGVDVVCLCYCFDDVVGEFGWVWGGELDLFQFVDVFVGLQ